jgi:hypothetical protein
MNKLRVLLVAAALLTAACGATTVSGSAAKSVPNAGTLGVGAGANAGTDLAAQTNDDIARTNPTVHKGGPVPVQQSQVPATTGAQPAASAIDRCSAGFGGGTGAAPVVGAPGKRPQLMCAPQ